LSLKLKRRRQWFLIGSFVLSVVLIQRLPMLNFEQIWQTSMGLIQPDLSPLFAVLMICGLLLATNALRRWIVWQKDNMGIGAIAGLAVVAQLLLAMFSWYFSKKPSAFFDGLTAASMMGRATLHVLLALGFGVIAVGLLAAPEKRISRQVAWFALALMVMVEGLLLRPKMSSINFSDFQRPSVLAGLENSGRILYFGFEDKKMPLSVRPSTLQKDGWSVFNTSHPFEDLRMMILPLHQIIENLATWSRVLHVHYILTPKDFKFENAQTLFEGGLITKVNLPGAPEVDLYRLDYRDPIFSSVRAMTAVTAESEAMAMVQTRGENRSPAYIERVEAYLRGKRLTQDNSFWSDWLPRFSNPNTLLAQTPVTITNEIRKNAESHFEITSAAPAVGIWRESFHPDWRAYSEKKEVPIFRVDFLNRGVFINNGTQQIDFNFEPENFKLAKWLSFFAGVILLLWFLLDLRRPKEDHWRPSGI